jgi:hypothetical protein
MAHTYHSRTQEVKAGGPWAVNRVALIQATSTLRRTRAKTELKGMRYEASGKRGAPNSL